MGLAPTLRTRRSEDGAAAVEFALVLIPLCLILFGIISYGYMLSVRQALTQAAAEGARAAAVAQGGDDAATAAARSAVERSMDGFGLDCGSAGMTCTASPPATCGDAQCVTVTVSYQYDDNEPLQIPMIPMPKTLSFTSTAEVN